MLERDNTGKITLRGQDSFWLFFFQRFSELSVNYLICEIQSFMHGKPLQMFSKSQV